MKPLKSALVAVSAGMSMGAAQAAVYTGTWDPAYGAPFADLGWRGQATFSVPDPCVGPGLVFAGSCAAPGMQVVSAQVEFYDLATNATFETLVFNPAVTVYSMNFDAGLNLTAVKTSFFAPVRATSTTANVDDYDFHLVFDGTGAKLFNTNWRQGISSPLDCFFGITDSTLCAYSIDVRTATGSTPFAFTTIQAPVPEPSTYALMLLGLAGLGITVRRRRH